MENVPGGSAIYGPIALLQGKVGTSHWEKGLTMTDSAISSVGYARWAIHLWRPWPLFLSLRPRS